VVKLLTLTHTQTLNKKGEKNMAGLIQRERLVPGTRLIRKFNKSLWPDVVNIPTLDALPPNRLQDRELLTGLRLPLPYPNPTTGVNDIQMWVLFEPGSPATFPSQLIRVVEGELIHSNSAGHSGSHTIHWHGIEPTPANDGVGHDSFEIGQYTYQWLASEAGFYFYHCHKNTVLHFEMGLYGGLIIDPPKPPGAPGSDPNPPYPLGGPGYVRANTPGLPGFDNATKTLRYDVERAWVCDSFDSRWHELGVNESMFTHGADPNIPNGQVGSGWTNTGILNDFRPDIFVITGVPIPAGANGQPDGNIPITPAAFPLNPDLAASAGVVSASVARGQTVLLHVLNADYLIQEYTLGIDALVIGADGRNFGTNARTQYTQPFVIPANTPFRLTSARRWSMIVRPTVAGVIPFKCDFLNWITQAREGTARTQITVT
jgi:hypothetical protein